jgi:outer membrane protein assembly factor BamB
MIAWISRGATTQRRGNVFAVVRCATDRQTSSFGVINNRVIISNFLSASCSGWQARNRAGRHRLHARMLTQSGNCRSERLEWRRLEWRRLSWLGLAWALLWMGPAAHAENWPGWRGTQQDGVSSESDLPRTWSAEQGIRWRADILGEGPSSPIVWEDRLWVTSAERLGERRWLHCLHRTTGQIVWSRHIDDPSPEISSALTGHAASTPVTDGRHVYVFFGNAGLYCFDVDGRQIWHQKLGDFETELGLATSPILFNDLVILVCDHDGDRFRSFDSFVVALDKRTGETRWRAERPGLFRSWSTPLVVPAARGHELVVAAQDHVRAYDVQTGKPAWSLEATTGWVAPSPVYVEGRIFVASGRAGPVVALRAAPGETQERQIWRIESVGAYVCSPLVYEGRVWLHNEDGIVHCYAAADGRLLGKSRLEGRFYSSAVAGDGKIYLTNIDGVTYVLRSADDFEVLRRNALHEECLASPAIAGRALFLRTRNRIYCIGAP